MATATRFDAFGPIKDGKTYGAEKPSFFSGISTRYYDKIKIDSNLIPHISIFARYMNPHFAAVSSETRDMFNRMI